MPEITSVEPQKSSYARASERRGIRRYNIFLDGEFAFGVDEDLIVNRRLVVGKIITPDGLQEILFEAEVGKLMERMYRWFAIRQHSEKEVREYFRIKNLEFRIKGKEQISQLVIDALIETLKKKGMVNDLEFAKAWVEARRKSKQKGIRAIKAELFQKGIDKVIVDELLVHSSSFMDQEEKIAREALEKKMRSWKNLEPREFRQKAVEFLLRKGFEYEIVKQVLDKLDDAL